MKRAEALEILRQHKQEVAEKYGVTRLGIFGSVARDEATAESDLDIVVEMSNPDLFYGPYQRRCGICNALPRRSNPLPGPDESIFKAAPR